MRDWFSYSLSALALLAVVAMFGFWAAVTELSTDKTVSRAADWPQFYQKTVSGYVRLPEEAQIVHAEHSYPFPLGEGFRVQFRLPAHQTPEEWLGRIAAASGFKPSYHKGRFLYDSGRERDLLRLEYLPARHLYEVQGGWD